jgi:antitoxin MazE
MNATIQKWGNSLAVRIPKSVAEQTHLGQGDDVQLHVDEEGIHIRPARRTYRLAVLLQKITQKNRHAETDWGEVGSEAR